MPLEVFQQEGKISRIEDPGDYFVHATANDKQAEAYNLFHVYGPFFSLPLLFMNGTFAAIGYH